MSQSFPTPAVEVVATLGDSIVGVRHVSDPRGGTTRRATRALIAGGAIGVVVGVLAFIAATRIAAGNQAALEVWTAGGKPAWAFRPETVPTWLSLVSFLGMSGGLTALITGLSRRRREREPSTVSIGSAAGVDFPLAGTVAPHVDLVGPQGDGFVLRLSGMTGQITDERGSRPIPPVATPVAVVPGLRVHATLGAVGFHIAAVDPPLRQTTPVLAFLERRTMSYFAMSAAAHLVLLGLSRLALPDSLLAPSEASFEEKLTYRMASVNMEQVPPEPDPAAQQGVGGYEGAPNAMALEKGKVGVEENPSEDPATRKIKDRGPDKELAREAALQQARIAGVLGSQAMAGDMFASVVGTGPVSSGFDDIDQLGCFGGPGEECNGSGAPYGFGQNQSGFGRGGGGWSFKVGGYNTLGDGKREGQGYNIGGGRCTTPGCVGGRTSKIPVVIGKPQDVIGDYDKEIIRRYVLRKKTAISYCYERELLVNPGLEGTVLAEWTITANGGVMESRASGVDAKVSSCIADVITSIHFPKPPAIGVFKVRYPFVLHNTTKG